MTTFFEFIKDFKAGHLDAQLTDKLTDLVDAVGRFQRKESSRLKSPSRPVLMARY